MTWSKLSVYLLLRTAFSNNLPAVCNNNQACCHDGKASNGGKDINHGMIQPGKKQQTAMENGTGKEPYCHCKQGAKEMDSFPA